jgi:hypothetical protein
MRLERSTNGLKGGLLALNCSPAHNHAKYGQTTQITPSDLRETMLLLKQAGYNDGGRHACYSAVNILLYGWEEVDSPPLNWHYLWI